MTKLRKLWKGFVEKFAIAIVIVAIVSAILTLFYLDYSAYKQRFPNAAPRTYIFQHK